jgi:hypothetical protein
MEVSLVAAMVKRWLGLARPEKRKRQPDQLKHEPKDHSMWRQGDVLIQRVDAIPERVQRSALPHGIIARGELTGHSHRLENPRSAMLFSGVHTLGELYLDVPTGGTRIIHEEHGPIDLPGGYYRVWRQREYSPRAIHATRMVGD